MPEPQPFELFRGSVKIKIGLDIDGVLCKRKVTRTLEDCIGAERSDLAVPSDSHEIYVVSSRTKNMEEKTKRWLAENEVEYERLVLYDGEGFEGMSEEEIDEEQGEFKADVINELGLEVFVEDRSSVRKRLRKRCPDCVVLSPKEAYGVWRFET